MSDVEVSVLRHFGRAEFLKTDTHLNGTPVPGLLYADDLVFFRLTADSLRLRLGRLCEYAHVNTLTVKVSKCEIVIFGKHSQTISFKYNRELIPVRHACKYLGIWLDGDLRGKTLVDALVHKFVTAVPVFFGLCRRLCLARLNLVYRLPNATPWYSHCCTGVSF
jgi:hypothetical protein